jgi:hypothetical protein
VVKPPDASPPKAPRPGRPLDLIGAKNAINLLCTTKSHTSVCQSCAPFGARLCVMTVTGGFTTG